MFATVIFLELGRVFNFLDIPEYTLHAGWRFIFPSSAYAFHAVLSLDALSGK